MICAGIITASRYLTHPEDFCVPLVHKEQLTESLAIRGVSQQTPWVSSTSVTKKISIKIH